MGSMHAFGNATVYQQLDENPNHSGGPIRRASGALVPAGQGPYTRAGTMVIRSPNNVVPDAEPGGAFYPELWSMKFLPDGRLVPQDALGGALGMTQAVRYQALVVGGSLAGALAGAFSTRTVKSIWVRGLGTAATTLLGVWLGAKIADKIDENEIVPQPKP